MSAPFTPCRTCPKCESRDYQFRSRKKVATESEDASDPLWETKFRCKACEGVWTVRETLRAAAKI